MSFYWLIHKSNQNSHRKSSLNAIACLHQLGSMVESSPAHQALMACGSCWTHSRPNFMLFLCEALLNYPCNHIPLQQFQGRGSLAFISFPMSSLHVYKKKLFDDYAAIRERNLCLLLSTVTWYGTLSTDFTPLNIWCVLKNMGIQN